MKSSSTAGLASTPHASYRLKARSPPPSRSNWPNGRLWSPSTGSRSTWTRKTGRVVTAPRPGDVRLSLFGPRMLAFTTCLKAELPGSYSAIQSLLTDAMGLTVSTGFLAKAMGRVSAALDGTYEQLTQTLREQDAVHVDETGHYEAGSRWEPLVDVGGHLPAGCGVPDSDRPGLGTARRAAGRRLRRHGVQRQLLGVSEVCS